MRDTNNKVNYEINVKQEEKRHIWFTMFAWLYLKTIGRILPKKWNKWAEDILYYDKATGSNEIHTDKTTDESAQIDLKLGVTEKESQSEIVREDEKVQINKVTFQDVAMQTDSLTTVDESAQIEPEIAEKESQSEVISKDGEVQTEENSEFNDEFIDEDYDSMEEVSTEEDEELKKQLEYVSQELEYVSQELELECSQNVFLEGENVELKSTIKRLEKNYKELAEDAGKREKELISVKEKDMKINSLTWSNEALEQDKKEMEAKNNEQQRTVFDQEKRIKEQDALIKSLAGKNKNISEAVKKDNESLRIQITELESKVSELKGESDTKAADIKQLEDKLNELRQQKQAELEQAKKKNAEVEDFRKHLQSAQESKQQLEKEKTDLESKLKDLNSQLSTTVKEKKDLENEVARLQEQVRTLEESKEWELAGIDDSLKKVFLDVIGMLEKELLINNQEQQLQGKKVDLIERLKAELKKESDEALQETREKIAEQEKLIEQLKKEQEQAEKAEIKELQEEKEGLLAERDNLKGNLSIVEEQLKQQLLSNNQEQHKLEKELKGVDKRLEDIGKTKKSQEQTKAHKPDAASFVGTVSTAKSSQSRLSKAQHFVDKLLPKNKTLDNFLSKKNEELKKGFPEFKEKYFCHNVLNETIKSLSNQDDSKFESSKLLELLESNLKQSAKEIIEAKVKKSCQRHSNIGKNIGKELRDGTLKAKLLTSVKQCMKNLNFNEKDAVATRDSILHRFNIKNNNNNDSGELLKEIVVKELVEARMRFFLDKIQELQLASSIRDKLLSPDQKMCNQTQGGVNKYQLTEKAKKEYTPHSSMSSPNIASIHSLNSRKAVKVGS